MDSNATGLSVLLTRPAATLFVLVAGIALAAGVCLSIEFVPFALGIACFVLLIALARLRTANLLIAFIVADHLCQFLKRAIFLLGPQPKVVYWGFQLLPTLILALAVASSLYSMRKSRFPLSTKLLMGFIAIAIAQTFFNLNGNDMVTRFAGANQAIIPLFAVFAGMTLPPSEWRRLSKLFLILIVVSSLYGAFQFFHGPTAMDRAWALQTGDYSIEASKVFAYMAGARPDFRAYSYYADPSTWGFFLVMAAFFVLAVRERNLVSPAWVKCAFGFALVGLLVAETRSVWLALLGALLVNWVLRSRSLRHPVLVITGILVSFGLVLSVGQYALEHWIPRLTGSALVNRYLTVGTLSARVSALEIFIRVLPRHIVRGDGYGSSGTSLETFDEGRAQGSDYYSHNAIVSLLLSVGLPGLLLYGCFLYRWLWESLRIVNLSPRFVARSHLWIVAACVGMLFTGAVTGPLFQNSSYFEMFLGLAMGETIRIRQRLEAERFIPIPELHRFHPMAPARGKVRV